METTQTQTQQPMSNQPPSFEQIWFDELASLGLMYDPQSGQLVYRTNDGDDTNANAVDNLAHAILTAVKTATGQPLDEGTSEEVAEEKPRSKFQQTALRQILGGVVDKTISEFPILSEVPLLKDATVAFLSELDPEEITDETVKATAFALFGYYVAQYLMYNNHMWTQHVQQNPVSALPYEVQRMAQKYGEVWGIDPQELLLDAMRGG